MAVMVITVPAAFVEQKLEAALCVLIVIFDKLLLREAVNYHEQHEFRERLSSRPIASFGLLHLFLDKLERAIELKIIGLAIGTACSVDLKFTVVELHFPPEQPCSLSEAWSRSFSSRVTGRSAN